MSDMKVLHLPPQLGREPGLQGRWLVLVTKHATWPAIVRGQPESRHVTGLNSALLALQLSPGKTACLTLLSYGRLLPTTEGQPQFIAVAARIPWPPATSSELEADISRLSVFKVDAASRLRITCSEVAILPRPYWPHVIFRPPRRKDRPIWEAFRAPSHS